MAAPSSSAAGATSQTAVLSTATAAPTLQIAPVSTVTACSTFDFQWALRNAVPQSYSVTLSVQNIGINQSIRPSGATVSAPAITSVRSSIRAVDPSSVTQATVSSSSAVSSSGAAVNAITTSTTPSSTIVPTRSAAVVTTSIAPRAATVIGRGVVPALAVRSFNLKKRSDISINGTLGSNVASVAFRWNGALPEGNYLVTYTVGGLPGVSASQQITVIEPDGADLSCLDPWLALSASDDLPTSTRARTTSSTGSARPSGSLAESSSGGESSASGGMIAGIVVGVVVGLGLLGLLAFCCIRRRRQRRNMVYSDFDYHKNERDMVNLDMDDFRGEKLNSTSGSPEQTWASGSGSGAGHGTSPTSADGYGKHGTGMGITPMPLGMIPRSERGSIDSISAKSVNVTAESHEGTGTYPPSTVPQLPPLAITAPTPGRTGSTTPKRSHATSIPDPFAHSLPTTPRTREGRDRRFDDGRRQSSPPVSPSGYTAAASSAADASYTSAALAQAFGGRGAGDRSSGVASDAMAGRRPSPPSIPGLGQPTGAQGTEPMQRKGSVKRKPVPSLGPALRKELSEKELQAQAAAGGRSRQGSASAAGQLGDFGTGTFGPGSGAGAGDRKEYVIMPDPPRHLL